MDDSELDHLATPAVTDSGRRRRKKRSGGLKALVAVVMLAILVGAGYFGVQKLDSWLNGPDDFEGRGTGSAVVKVNPGDNGATIARTLHAEGVVASSEAFYQLSLSDPRAQSIQPGTYQLRKEMSALFALEALVDPSTRVGDRVTIPEGTRIGQVVELIADNTKISAEELEKVLENPDSIGLPPQANGNAEGFLFPETYFVEPDTSAEELLSQMVANTLSTLEDLEYGPKARALGVSGVDIITIASLLEHEGRQEQDFAKISRVIYNRLELSMPLQLDSTVHYVSERTGDVWTTPDERANPSEFNTYQHAGLPPGPIGSPGRMTLEAALNPADGPWLYFLTVDLKTGETVFNTTYPDHVADCKRVYGAQTQC